MKTRSASVFACFLFFNSYCLSTLMDQTQIAWPRLEVLCLCFVLFGWLQALDMNSKSLNYYKSNFEIVRF